MANAEQMQSCLSFSMFRWNLIPGRPMENNKVHMSCRDRREIE